VLYGQLGQYLGEVFRPFPEQKESRIEQGHLLVDHVRIMISIPPKYAVARVHGDRRQNYVRQNFWARGYSVSTVGRDEAEIREYIRN
jgi:putative transposase